MNREEVRLLGFEIVAFAGDARPKFLEALTTAQVGDSAKVDALIEEGSNCIAEAYGAQTNLLAKGAQGDGITYSVMMMHGQDHLMIATLLKDLMKHLSKFYRRG